MNKSCEAGASAEGSWRPTGWGHTIDCMWPKAFSQFIELAPHISRLLPLADRFLQNKTGSEDAGRRALNSVSAELQTELGQIAAAQTGLAKQISTLSDHVATAGNDSHLVRAALEALESRAAMAEAGAASLDTRLTIIESRLGGVDAHLQRVAERVRLSPVVLLLVLTNLLLLAALIAVLLRGR